MASLRVGMLIKHICLNWTTNSDKVKVKCVQNHFKEEHKWEICVITHQRFLSRILKGLCNFNEKSSHSNCLILPDLLSCNKSESSCPAAHSHFTSISFRFTLLLILQETPPAICRCSEVSWEAAVMDFWGRCCSSSSFSLIYDVSSHKSCINNTSCCAHKTLFQDG